MFSSYTLSICCTIGPTLRSVQLSKEVLFCCFVVLGGKQEGVVLGAKQGGGKKGEKKPRILRMVDSKTNTKPPKTHTHTGPRFSLTALGLGPPYENPASPTAGLTARVSCYQCVFFFFVWFFVFVFDAVGVSFDVPLQVRARCGNHRCGRPR